MQQVRELLPSVLHALAFVLCPPPFALPPASP